MTIRPPHPFAPPAIRLPFRIGRIKIGTFSLLAIGLALAAISMIQLLLGTLPVVLAMADAAVVATVLFLAAAPMRVGSWFALVQLLQLFGAALVFKTVMLTRFDSGLLEPVVSVGLCLVVITMTGISTVTQKAAHERDYLLARFYGDPDRWSAAGLIFLVLGEGATWLNYIVNRHAVQGFGGFSPLVHFKIAGIALLASGAMRKGKIMTPLLLGALVMAMVEALLFNSKGEAIFRFAAYGIALIVQPGRAVKKLLAIGVGVLILVASDRVVFPVIHVLRTDEFRGASLGERATMIDRIFSGNLYTWKDLSTQQSGSVTDDYIRFVATNDGFVNRFASLGYLDTTVALGNPDVTRQSFGTFLRDCLADTLPAQLSPGKGHVSLADRLWVSIDPQFTVGGFATMGTIASARLVFGPWFGLAIVISAFWAVLFLWQRWYGSDVRTPLLQFLLVDSVAGFVDGDIEGLFQYLLRFFWQDLIIVAAVGYLVALLHRKSARLVWGRVPPPAHE